MKHEAERRLNDLKRELDARPSVCPWCGDKAMFQQHAPKKHPGKYEEWKQGHEKLELSGTIWVEA